MNFLKASMERSVLTSDENIKKFIAAREKLKADIESGNLILFPKNEAEEKIFKRQKAESDCKSYNAEIGNENAADNYNCDICKNKGMIAEVVEDENGCRVAYMQCKCRTVRNFLRKAQASGLKDVLKKYTFKTYIATEEWQKKLKSAAQRFMSDDDSNWFFIGGQSGSGKSHLCTAICTHYLKSGNEVKYMMWRDDVNYIKSIINDSEAYQQAVKKYKKVKVLYIDDLFKMGMNQTGEIPRPTAADINLAFEILNYRYNNNGLITIISSERQISDIMDIDEAIGGRIYEMTVRGGYVLNVKNGVGKNYRIKNIVEI